MPSYCVSGAGTTAYNGTYDPFSSSEYRKVGTPTIKFFYNGDDLWIFINGSTEGYVATGSGTAPPLTGWTVSGRPVSEPAPTLTEGACSTPTPTPTPTPSPTPNTIRIKRSSTTTATPTSLLEGELAANITDQKLFIGNSSKTPVLISDYKAMGTVTSVGLTVPTGLTVTGTPVTTLGTLAVTLTSGYSIPTTASQTNWDSAYTQRLQWDGGSTNLVAATGRTSLGATTVGANLFTLTNPSQVTFPRFNLDNTVSALSANTAINALLPSQTGNSGKYLTTNGGNTSWGAVTSGPLFTASATAPASPAVGDRWYDTDDAALLVYINDGNTSQWVEAGSPSVGAAAIQSNGRLTLESGVPVSSTDQTAKTTVYYTPYNGNILSLYNGTSWNAYTFAELSLTTSGLVANRNYDVFAYVSGSSVALEFSDAWTGDFIRSTNFTLLNGVYVKTLDTTRRYLGTIRTNASTQFTDSLANRLVWNFNNKVLRSMFGFIYSLSHSYNGGVREYNGGTSVTRLYFITGINGETFLANATAPVTCGGTSANVLFGLDSTTIQFGACVSDDRAATFTRRSISSLGQVNAGFHYLTGLQNTESSGASTYFDFQASGSLLC